MDNHHTPDTDAEKATPETPETTEQQPYTYPDGQTMDSNYVPGRAAEAGDEQPKPISKARKAMIALAITTGAALSVAGAVTLLSPSSITDTPKPDDGDGTNGNKPDNAGTNENTPLPADKSELLPSEMNLEIPTGLSTEELGRTIISRFDSWQNAGSNNQSLIDEWHANPTVNTKAFAQDKADGFAKEFADALYVDGWESHEDLTKDYNSTVVINGQTLNFNLVTSDKANGDKVPYRYSANFNSAEEITPDNGDGVRTIQINYNYSSNAGMNRVGETVGNPADSEVKNDDIILTITLVKDGDSDRIASVSYALAQ